MRKGTRRPQNRLKSCVTYLQVHKNTCAKFQGSPSLPAKTELTCGSAEQGVECAPKKNQGDTNSGLERDMR